MNSMDRRNFLKIAATGAAAAAAAAVPMAVAVPMAARFSAGAAGRLSFRATTGLPPKPLPAYATQVVEGNINLARGTGLVTTQVFAGHTEGVSDIALPGMSRTIRITSVAQEGVSVRLAGVIDDRSQLTQGENAQVEILIDRALGVVKAPLAGRQVTLKLIQ